MITINSLLFTCEHPKVITTKDNRKMVVSCGKCRSCLVQKHRCKSLVCNEHEKLHKYCFFVTLTYNKENVPCAYPLFLKDSATNRQYVELYDEDTGELLGSPNYPHDLLRKIMNRCDDKKLHYCRYSDLQKFIKRLRRRIEYSKLYNNEKITYYSVSEYGPRTFRPHFHVLFYTDNPRLSQNFRQLVSACWKSGYSYTTLSKGHCSSYVASYVNSHVSIPEVLQCDSTRPKSSHSSCMGLPLHEGEFAKIYKNEPTRFVRYCQHDYDGKISMSAPWRSFKCFLFPRCYRYTCKDFYQRVATYNCLSSLVRRYGKQKIVDYIPLLKKDFLNSKLPLRILDSIFTQDYRGYVLPTDEILLSRLYALSHYKYLMDTFQLTPVQLCVNIDKFYSALDYENLKEMYGTIQESEHLLSPSDYELFSQCYAYQTQLSDDDVIDFNGMLLEVSWLKDTYYKSNLYAAIANSRATSYQKSIKHKFLNDLNNIFLINNEQCNVYEVNS